MWFAILNIRQKETKKIFFKEKLMQRKGVLKFFKKIFGFINESRFICNENDSHSANIRNKRIFINMIYTSLVVLIIIILLV
ncbi:hypothetical protein Emtol_1795 [Emticicia oligotrophica DSM 17448]|uniref:Uncharacterized protein n=1 Tax=Emticicia oligotrophica (strain DSM 17448 / CIP 109782 / MTCC 6937 / GPTSA100-15) TaxID=929562 RepID=A0ABM5N0J3_EMTOG|nr:hypothetical protein Emtol_1795 [Emticicia oligotrophica DSM 17448]